MKDKLTIGILAFIKNRNLLPWLHIFLDFVYLLSIIVFFDKLSTSNQEFVINKSKKASEFQRQLAVLEDENILKEINWQT